MPDDPEVIAGIVAWLAGRFKEGSPEDLEARRALARFLRGPLGPLDQAPLFMLAALIDPDKRDDLSLWLVFKRPRGNRSRPMNHRRVAAVIWHELRAGKPQKAAVSIAREKCKVSRSKALEAFDEWKPLFEKHGSKLKWLTRTD
jgi:hypothetical protein